jgi:hypothetical protein
MRFKCLRETEENKLEFQATFKGLKREAMRTRRYVGTNKMESSDVQRTTETALAMGLLGVKGIRRKLRGKLWGSDRGRNTKVRRRRGRSRSSINICCKDLKDLCKSSFSVLRNDS